MAYAKLCPHLSEKDKKSINAIIDEMVKRNDCVKKLIRILKAVDLDVKSSY
jgi:hypothetical protein